MEKFLAQQLTIANHPIKEFKEIFKQQYVRGIGEFLCYITKDDRITKFIFEIWCKSIVDKIPTDAWSFTSDFYAIKEGLAVHRNCLLFFNMRQAFLFDCFYLLEKSRKNLRIDGFAFLLDSICGYFSKSTLLYVNEFFKGENDGEKIPDALRSHRRISRDFVNKRLKRVLVVATMSAGKSTLVNALVGHKINKVRSTACTSRVHYIYNKPAPEGALASFEDKKLVYTDNYPSLALENVQSVGINFNSSLSKSRVCIIDTPGVNYNGDKTHGELTRSIIKENNYDLLLLVMNANQLAIEDERDLISFIGKHSKRKVIGVLNQCDCYKPSQDSISEALDTSIAMMKEAGIHSPFVIPISAYAAHLYRQIIENSKHRDQEVEEEYAEINKKMQKPFYNLPSYISGVPKDIRVVNTIDRTGVPYLEYLINNY